MIVDVHCHTGFSARTVDPTIPRFSFERRGAAAHPGFDAYFSPRLIHKWRLALRWRPIQRAMGIDWDGRPGPDFDRQIQAFYDRHLLAAPGVNRMVLLAFDEYHRDDGAPVGPAARGERGGDLYVSNSLVRLLCARRPDAFLFGASLHPYRRIDGRDAASALDELKSAGAVLVKWLPVHQNIRAADPRTIAFLRRAAELRLAMLIHYGGELTLARQHPEFESPAELLDVLRGLRKAGRMPTVIVAHAATPSTRLQSAAGHRMLVDALLGEFRDAPLYADVSALAALGRAPWLPRLARRHELHAKLVWGTDFPVPLFPIQFWRRLDRSVIRSIRRARDVARIPSWIERDLALKRAIGFDESIFHRAGEILDRPH